MQEAIRVINQLKADDIIKDYAIGGGMAAIYYAETRLTYDLDVFVLLPDKAPTLPPLIKRNYSGFNFC
ncbi:MAG: hypothetical protein QME74_01160 [Candidatus Edwardsbacteria bacterium]|nr:hypothetical protein [Candidatus Edwardsbacteria bacterium]